MTVVVVEITFKNIEGKIVFLLMFLQWILLCWDRSKDMECISWFINTT
jgi:hypothetical protein